MIMKKSFYVFPGLCLACVLFIFSCETKPAEPWESFTACAGASCVNEAVSVGDAFLEDPAAMLKNFRLTDQKGEDTFVGWMYLMRDSVLLNMDFATAEDRASMQQALIEAARPYETDPELGEYASAIIREFSISATESEAGEMPGEFAPVTGTYRFELPGDGGTGELTVSRTDGENIHFELSVVAGPPAHNQGTMEGEAVLESMNVYEYTTTDFGGSCRLQFIFDRESVEINTLEGDPASCGFGNGVIPDQVYKMVSSNDPSLSEDDAKAAQSLEGNWISADDEKSEIRIGKGLYTEIYDGEEMGDLPYKYFAKCPASCNPAGETACLRVMGQDDICYAIVKAGPSSLELSMIGGTGNTLIFKRK